VYSLLAGRNRLHCLDSCNAVHHPSYALLYLLRILLLNKTPFRRPQRHTIAVAPHHLTDVNSVVGSVRAKNPKNVYYIKDLF